MRVLLEYLEREREEALFLERERRRKKKNGEKECAFIFSPFLLHLLLHETNFSLTSISTLHSLFHFFLN
jgi:predicted Zn-dependent protease